MMDLWDNLFTLIWIVVRILLIMIPLVIVVAYTTYAERKVIGYIQARIGPNRVGFRGLLQPFADVIKLLLKEFILPTESNHALFILAPVLCITPAIAAWAVIPFADGWALSNINAGVLYLLALSSSSVYGVLIAGWASNSKYALFGAMRAAAQTVSYEIAMGMALVGVLLAAQSMNLQEIVVKQQGGIWHWYWIPLFPLMLVYWISGIAETNRAPFDVAEGESEIVAGFHVEYSGMGFAIFFLAEYMNMVLIATLVALFFFGGWLSPFQGIPVLENLFAWVPGLIWLSLKSGFFIFSYLWYRATFPRYRYDQIMRLGWKILIPVSLVWIVVVALFVQCGLSPWFN